MVRFDELETVRSFLNQELHEVEKYHVDRREMRIIVVPFLLWSDIGSANSEQRAPGALSIINFLIDI